MNIQRSEKGLYSEIIKNWTQRCYLTIKVHKWRRQAQVAFYERAKLAATSRGFHETIPSWIMLRVAEYSAIKFKTFA